MRIAYVCYAFYPGEAPFLAQTQELAKLGAEVYAIALRRDNEPAEGRVGDVCVLRVFDRPYAYEGTYKDFLRFLGHAASQLATLPRLDIVNVRNSPGASFVRHWAHNQARRWVMEIQSPPLHGEFRAQLSNVRTRLEARAFDLTLVHRQAVGEAIFGQSTGRFVECPAGVDFDHFVPGRNSALRENLGVQQGDLLVIYTGSIEPRRTLHTMLAGFEQANRSLGNLHLLVVGNGSDLPRLRSLADDMGIADKTHFVGYVPYAQMPTYMQAADIGLCYVPVTPWFDKAPVLKTLESLASGLPTIATATQGNQAYIRHGQNGWLVDDSPSSIAEGIHTLCLHDDLRLAFRNGRDSIRAYDWSRIVRDVLLPAYATLLG